MDETKKYSDYFDGLLDRLDALARYSENMDMLLSNLDLLPENTPLEKQLFSALYGLLDRLVVDLNEEYLIFRKHQKGGYFSEVKPSHLKRLERMLQRSIKKSRDSRDYYFKLSKRRGDVSATPGLFKSDKWVGSQE